MTVPAEIKVNFFGLLGWLVAGLGLVYVLRLKFRPSYDSLHGYKIVQSLRLTHS